MKHPVLPVQAWAHAARGFGVLSVIAVTSISSDEDLATSGSELTCEHHLDSPPKRTLYPTVNSSTVAVA